MPAGAYSASVALSVCASNVNLKKVVCYAEVPRDSSTCTAGDQTDSQCFRHLTRYKIISPASSLGDLANFTGAALPFVS